MKKKYGDKIREVIYQQELKPVYRSIFTNEIQNILYEAIDQIREETIREVDKYINDLEKYAKDNWEDQDTVNEAYFAIAQLNKLKK